MKTLIIPFFGLIATAGASMAWVAPSHAGGDMLASVHTAMQGIDVEPRVPHELVITIAGPDDLRFEEAVDAGGTLLDIAGALPDGVYRYEISIVSLGGRPRPAASADPRLGSDENGRPAGAVPRGEALDRAGTPARQSGAFTVLDGVIVDPLVRE